MISHEELLRILHYDPETGIFTWIDPFLPNFIGKKAGTVMSNGYIRIRLDNGKIKLYGHRLAWFYVNGTWPPKFIDHIDNNRSNNSISNLRLADTKTNQYNKTKMTNNTSGYIGVRFCKQTNKYRADIRVEGVKICIGFFTNILDAAKAYDRVALETRGDYAKMNEV